MNYIITSYFTPAYAPIANKRLKQSLRELTIPHYVASLTDRGNWQSNTLFKAQFIQNMMARFPKRGIVFVDADAMIRSVPSLFQTLYDDGVDFAAHLRTWRRGRIKNEMLSGTLYFGPTYFAAELVRMWIDENKKHRTRLEQKNLAAVFDAIRTHDVFVDDEPVTMKFYELPVEYCAVFDGDDRPENPVIEHFQASRQMRRRQ